MTIAEASAPAGGHLDLAVARTLLHLLDGDGGLD
jgi:hypothetical protein